jgi:hypothetical protein
MRNRIFSLQKEKIKEQENNELETKRDYYNKLLQKKKEIANEKLKEILGT